jgi:hypothetical protein
VLETRYGIPVAGQTLDPLYWLEAAAARHTSNDTPAWRSGFWMIFVNPPWATSPWNCRSSSTVDVVRDKAKDDLPCQRRCLRTRSVKGKGSW